MKEKTKNLLRIILNILDTILHLFIKKEDTPSQNPDHSHPELVSGSDQLVSGSDQLVSGSDQLVSGSETIDENK